MTNREAQQVISAFLFRIGLEGIEMTDPELKALVMAATALDNEWISVENMLPPITNEEERTTDKALIRMLSCNMDVAWYDYRHKVWEDVNKYFQNVTHWRPLPDGPEVE